MTRSVTMNQWRSEVADGLQGALAHTPIARLDDAGDGNGAPPSTAGGDAGAAGVRLRQLPADSGFLCLRARGDAIPALDAAMQSIVGLPLAARLQRVATACAGAGTNAAASREAIRWMSPDEWLLSAPQARLTDIETALRERVTRGIAIVNVSGNQAGLVLTGPDAREVLMKSTGYDVHPANLPVGKVVNTTFAKAGVTLACIGDDAYEILVRRSFADYVWLWLQNAAFEHGLDIGGA